jgi:hypothetical protein
MSSNLLLAISWPRERWKIVISLAKLTSFQLRENSDVDNSRGSRARSQG